MIFYHDLILKISLHVVQEDVGLEDALLTFDLGTVMC